MEEVSHHLGKQPLTMAPTSVGLRVSVPRIRKKTAEDDHLPQAKSRKNGKGQLGEPSTDSDPTSVGLRL